MRRLFFATLAVATAALPAMLHADQSAPFHCGTCRDAIKNKAAQDAALLNAAAVGDTPAALRALSKGADIEARDGQYGFTPLMWASWRARLGTMRHLIAKGAKVNAATESASPSNVVLRDSAQQTAIGHMSLFVRNSGVTPLLLAASSGSGMAVEELLKHGANIKAKTVSGETALLAAADAGTLTAVKALIAKGADPNEASDGINHMNGPLFISIMRGNEGVVKELVNAGANLTPVLPVFGSYDLMARRFGQRRIADFLTQARRRQLAQQALKKKQLSEIKQPQSNTVTIIKADGSVEIVR